MCGKITITLTRKRNFDINNLYINLHSFSNTTILHEEHNSLNLKVLTLLQQ